MQMLMDFPETRSLFLRGGGMSDTYSLTTTEEEGVGDHLPTPVMAATAMETDSENVAYTEVNLENEACRLSLNGYSQKQLWTNKEIDTLRISTYMEIVILRIT